MSLTDIPAHVLELVDGMTGGQLVEQRIGTKAWDEINQFERAAAEYPQISCPLVHTFTPGLYTRQITMPAGMLITSRIHLFEHPFVIAKGVVSVWSNEAGWEMFRAPHLGVTKPATRRILYIHEDVVWLTFHVNPDNETNPDKIVDRVTYDHMKLGHMDDLSQDRLAAVQSNAKESKLLP